MAFIRKRGKKFSVIYRIKDENGKERQTSETFSTQKDAESQLNGEHNGHRDTERSVLRFMAEEEHATECAKGTVKHDEREQKCLRHPTALHCGPMFVHAEHGKGQHAHDKQDI